ncbi:cytochrome c oxidase subunit II [Alienimonas californiensis]|uniref:cytochrome-c oxidase n=1 Tax=Alienimonas californiensis TaxID=2527989 RepID=A0A517PA13_9PLAN|nr:cytochrome c oxidase subunit II [Alienimonas californiensis]QDT16213.1 Cytochrome c oxidase subunit 2 precursor [Alienimonas californiensis]
MTDRPGPVRRPLAAVKALLGALSAVAAAGCGGTQSALDPAGPAAAEVLTLFWWMLGGAILIWALVAGLAVYAIVIDRPRHDPAATRWWVIGGGVVAPTVILTVLLIYGLRLIPPLVRDAPADSLTVEVDGVRWWWRMRYRTPDGPVETANELCLPVGEPVQFLLRSDDVIHSFWIPALGGKMDMIPGRENRLALQADRAGTFRGACAEYCGASHALMNFDVRTLPRAEFEAWLAGQAAPAAAPETALAERGERLFLASGCGACHAVRGTAADGGVGPDLTHIGGRLTIGAGLLPNDEDTLMRWIARCDELKPDVDMPAFDHLSDDELRALAVYLKGLR